MARAREDRHARLLMRSTFTMTLALGALALAACKTTAKSEGSTQSEAKVTEPTHTPPATTSPPAPGEAATEVGVQAGGILHDDNEGPAAVVTAVSGTVEVRRVGEPSFAAAKVEATLYPGDLVSTGDKATATVVLADESVIELAEVSAVGIASRDGTADPASAAAVLAGVARFTVSARAPGEGPFRVYTPGGMIVTRGTVSVVGVAASGQARVGVESGSADVIGLAAVDATPVMVDGGAAATLDMSGTVADAVRWAEDDWGAWREATDAKLEVAAAIDAHAKAMEGLTAALKEAYAQLEATADSAATFEATAATSADRADVAAYQAAATEGAATIDASFAVSSRLEALTWAYAGHATLATELYVRHSTQAEARWMAIAPRVDAALLWPKRFEVTAVGYLEPLRAQYYVHHPRGRMHAELAGVTVPEFYAKIEPPRVEPEAVRARVKTKLWIAPEMTFKAQTRPVWTDAPSADWWASVKVKPAPMRAKAAWYVRPPTLTASVLVGAAVRASYTSKIAVTSPETRSRLAASWKIPIGVKIKVGAPDLATAARARAALALDGTGRIVARDHRDVAVPQVPAAGAR
jgi:hypothetical protein